MALEWQIPSNSSMYFAFNSRTFYWKGGAGKGGKKGLTKHIQKFY
jgi:hypothetical protein